MCFGGSSLDLRVARWTVTTNGIISPQGPDPGRTPWLHAGTLLTNIEPVDAHSVTPEFAAGAPNPPVTYKVDRFTTDHGLPSNQIQALCQSPDGSLWVGTSRGLARFDGNRFAVFDSRNTPALQELGDSIRALVCDSEGNIWVATVDGLLRQKNDEFVAIPGVARAAVGKISRLAPRRAGGVWACAEAGLWLCTETELRRVSESGWAFAVLEDSTDSLVACFGESTLRMDLKSEVWTEIYRNHPTNPLFGSGSGFDLVKDRNGSLILATTSAILREAAPSGHLEKVLQPIDPIVPAGMSVLRPVISFAGDCLVLIEGTSRSLSLWVNGQRRSFTTTDGLPINNIFYPLVDRDEVIWLGTSDAGVLRLRLQPITTLTIAESGGQARVLSVCEGADGSIWCGTRTGMFQWGTREVRIFDFLGFVGFGPPNSMLRSSLGEIWATFGEQGLLQFATFGGNESAPHRLGPAELGTRAFEQVGPARVLYKTRDDCVWMGTKSGLFRGGAESGFFTTRQGLPHDDVRALHEDRQSHLWIGTFGGGLARLRDQKAPLDSTHAFDVFGQELGLSHNKVWAIHEDESGVLWLGTAAGLNRFQNGRFFSFARVPGMIAGELNHILEDDDGRLWLSSNDGIVRVDRQALNAFADGHTNQIPTYHYNASDGMLDAECNGEQQPSGCRASDGRLYFVTQRGVVMIDPRAQPPDTPPPTVVIEEVVANDEIVWPASRTKRIAGAGRPLPAVDSLTLAPDSADSLEIRFAAISISASEPPRVEYRLEGFDTAWRPATTERVASYTNLKPKTYRFAVRAADSHWVQNDAQTALTLTLQRHFWTTVPFYVVCGVLLAGTAGIFHAVRIRWQRRHSELQRAQAVDYERARIARDLHDQLGAKLSKLALNTGSLEAHQQGVRETLQELHELIWRVNPHNDSLAGLADFLGDAARQYLEAGGIELCLQFPRPLPEATISSLTRHQIAAAFHEALRNALQHSGATQVTVSLRITSGNLHLEVADNGRGFDQATRSDRGTGLANLRSRLAEVKGQCLVDSRPGSGTRILLQVPLGST